MTTIATHTVENAPSAGSRRGLDLVGILIGRNAADNAWTAGGQLLTAVVGLFLLPDLLYALYDGAYDATSQLGSHGENRWSLGGAISGWNKTRLIVVGASVVVSLAVFWMTQRPKGMSGLRRWCRAFWRGVLISLPWFFALYFVLELVLGLIPQHPYGYSSEVALLLGAALVFGVVLLPALFFERRQKRGLMQAKWRPKCPECGHSVRGAVSGRCTECGVTFPKVDCPGYRWGALRLPWEQRGASFVTTYGPTEFLVLFRPLHAGARCAAPGRWWRVVLFLVPAIAVVIATRAAAVGVPHIIAKWTRPQNTVNLTTPEYLKAIWDDFYEFLGTTFLHEVGRFWLPWVLLLGAIPLVGVLLAWFYPVHGSRAARQARMKWSIYAALVPIALAVAYGMIPIVAAALAGPPTVPLPRIAKRVPAGLLTPDVSFTDLFDALQPSVPLLFAFAYGVYWAAGLSRSPYNQYRGCGMFSLLLFIYVGVWWVFENWLFPPGVLVALL